MTGQRRQIAWFYATGVLAAAQLGRMSALAPLINAELALGLTVTGLLISLIEIGGASLGFAAGLMVDRLGVRRVLIAGLVLMAASQLGQAQATAAFPLIAWRASEGAAYLCIVVTAPLLIYRTAPPQRRGVALALWGSFVPVGFALGAVSAAYLAEAASWRSATLAWAAVAAAMALVTTRAAFPAVAPAAPGQRSAPGWRIWALTLGFGCYAAFAVGTIALLPSFLVERAGAMPGSAGLIGGLAAFIAVLGVVAAAWLRHRAPESRGWMNVSIVLPALLLFAVFVDAPVLWQVTTLMLVLNAISGLYPGLAFALLPSLAQSDTEMAAANGLILQFGAAGSLAGPPLLAACVERWGWSGAALAAALVSILCLVLMQGARVSAHELRLHALR